MIAMKLRSFKFRDDDGCVGDNFVMVYVLTCKMRLHAFRIEIQTLNK